MNIIPFTSNKNFVLLYDNDLTWSGVDKTENRIIPEIQDIVAVLNNVKNMFEPYYGSEYINNIHVIIYTTDDDPTSFKEYNLIFLSARGRYWCQYAYQFSHELCHLTIPQKIPESFRWFEESICELASIFFMIKMSEKWIIEPPYSNWGNYSQSLSNYANNVLSTKPITIPDNSNYAKYFNDNMTFLSSHCYERNINCLCAKHMLPIFKETPELWADVPHIARLSENLDFYSALLEWKEMSTEKVAIEKIINLFKFN